MSGRAMAALIRREWAAVWSGGTAYAMRTAYGLLLLGVTLLYGFHRSDEMFLGDADRWAETSAEVVGIAVNAQLLLLTIFALAYFPPALLREKEQRTMDLLLLSPLRGAEILLGKTVGALLGFVVLMLTGVPALMLLQVVGGSSTAELISAHLIVFGTVMIVAAVCTLLSAWSSRPATVMFWAVALTAAYASLPWLGTIFVPAGSPAWTTPAEWNPAAILQAELDGVGVETASVGVLVAGVVSLLVACVAGGAALYGRHARAQERRSPWRPRWTGASLLRVKDPVARRFAARAARPLFLLSAAGFAVLGTATVLYFMGAPMWEEYGMTAIVVEAVAVALAASVGAASDADDRRRDGSLELMLASNAEPATIVRALLSAALARSLLLMSVPTAHWVFYVVFGGGFWGLDVFNPLLVPAGFIAGAVTAVWVGTAVGVRMRGQVEAILTALAVAPPLVLAVFAAVSLNVATCAITLALWVPAMRWIYAAAAHRLRAGALTS